MRVLVLTTEVAGSGGIQYANRLFLRALRDLGASGSQLRAISLRDDPPSGDAWNGVSLLGCGGGRGRTALRFWRECRGQDWDLVVLGHLNLARLLLFVPLRRTRVLAWIYGWEAWRTIRPLDRRGLARAHRLLYISEHTRQAAQAHNPWLAPLPSGVCHLGLLAETPSSETAESFGPLDSSFVLSTGRMARQEAYKGHEELIRAWPEVQRRHPDTRLVLVGEGDDRPRLQRIAAATGGDIHFLGGVSDALRDACLRNCRAFCLPSRGEGFGLVYLEAMQASKPVLAGSQDAGREIVLDGVTGRTVDPHDRQALVQGILEILGERGEQMGRAGRQRYEDEFQYSRFLERFKGHLTSILGEAA